MINIEGLINVEHLCNRIKTTKTEFIAGLKKKGWINEDGIPTDAGDYNGISLLNKRFMDNTDRGFELYVSYILYDKIIKFWKEERK